MKYPYYVYQMQVENHTFWVAESPALKGCVGQGDTQEEAVSELEVNEAEWLATAEEYGIEIPAVPTRTAEQYSGKFTMRISPVEHKKAVELAKQEGVSLNQYVNDAIVARNSELRSLNYVSAATEDTARKIMAMARLLPGSTTQQTTGYPLRIGTREESKYITRALA